MTRSRDGGLITAAYNELVVVRMIFYCRRRRRCCCYYYMIIYDDKKNKTRVIYLETPRDQYFDGIHYIYEYLRVHFLIHFSKLFTRSNRHLFRRCRTIII